MKKHLMSSDLCLTIWRMQPFMVIGNWCIAWGFSPEQCATVVASNKVKCKCKTFKLRIKRSKGMGKLKWHFVVSLIHNKEDIACLDIYHAWYGTDWVDISSLWRVDCSGGGQTMHKYNRDTISVIIYGPISTVLELLWVGTVGDTGSLNFRDASSI